MQFQYEKQTDLTAQNNCAKIDRSLEILGRMVSLERLEFWQCRGITNAGVAHLAGLPRLREISLDGLAGVTRDAAALFPASVQVNYSA